MSPRRRREARNLVDGTEYTINANAVVITTGGYAGSAELQEQFLTDKYFPIKGVWAHYGSRQNDGKMIRAAMDAGAGTYNVGMPPEVHTCGTETVLTSQFELHYLEGQVGLVSNRPAYWTEGDLPQNMGWNPASLAVDKNGQRFTSDEGVAFLDPWIAGPNFYSIWSTEQIEKLKTEGFHATAPMGSIFIGSGTPIPGETPVPNVDEVLEADTEKVIGGLYAVGTDAMGTLFTEQKPYVTYGGANNGWGLVSGYLCGREIAEKLGK